LGFCKAVYFSICRVCGYRNINIGVALMVAIKANQAYSATALAKSSAGFRNSVSKSASRRSIVASFLRPEFMVGCSERRLAVPADLLPVFLALYSLPPSCLETNGGSPFNLQEDTTMSNDPARIEKAVHLFSQLPLEKQHFFLIFLRTWISYWGLL
jgi:hypothetical protein